MKTPDTYLSTWEGVKLIDNCVFPFPLSELEALLPHSPVTLS